MILMVRKRGIILILISVLVLSVFSQGSANLLTNNEKKVSALSGNRIMILVDDAIYESLSSDLSIFVDDIEKDGYEVNLYHKKLSSQEWGSPEKVRKFIKSHSENLAGCILVGHIPIPKYRIKGYMNKNETFPCDYYYMDLDGDWEIYEDTGWYNGYFYTIFCNHTDGGGDINPEIWVGRISPDKWVGEETELLREYFNRNHEYRTGQLSRPSRALLYVDDAYVSVVDEYKQNIKNLYPSALINTVSDKEKTRAEHYMNKIKSDEYEWVELHAHSNSLHHQFKYNDGKRGESLTVWDLKQNFTKSLFYLLYSCEALNYFTRCLGNLYLFGKTSGLVVIGSSKVGSFNDKGKNLYQKLGEGCNIGEAFKYWYNERGIDWPQYCFGMMIFGDPTLKPIKDTFGPEVSINFPKKGNIYYMGREILKINPTDRIDSIVIYPMEMEIDAEDPNGVEDVDVYVDSIRYSANKINDNSWTFPIINNNPNIPEIHTYQAEAIDLFENSGHSEERKICSIKANSPPFVLQQIDGEISGKTGVKYSYSVKLFDIEGDDVYLQFDWGDGSVTDWLGAIKTKAINPDKIELIDDQLIPFEQEHEFKTSGSHTIIVKIKDGNDNEGLFKANLDVKIEKKTRSLSMINRLQQFFKEIFER